MLEHWWRKVLTRARQRRPKDVKHCTRAKPRLRSSRVSGFTTSANDLLQGITLRSWHGSKRTYFRKLDPDPLQKLMRLSCWTSFGRLNNAVCSRLRGDCASAAGRYFAMPLSPGGQSMIRLPV